MPRPLAGAGGGLADVRYSLRKGREAGGILEFYRRMRARNACKACGLGTGGGRGGMVDELGRFPEVCRKSIEAQAGDMQAPITESFFRDHSIDEIERWSPMQLEYAGRLAFPVAWDEGDTHFRRVGWDEALDRLAAELTATAPDQAFFYASGRSSNEAAFLLQVLARAYGTTNIHSCTSYCHRASEIALERMFGSTAATLTLDDLDRTDLAIVAGANPASNHPRLISRLVALRRRGGQVIVVNPMREPGMTRFHAPNDRRSMLFGSDVADLYLQPHVATDVSAFRAILKGVLEREGEDRIYLRNHVDGWEAVEAHTRQADRDSLLAETGLSREGVDRAVEAICSAKRGVCLWGMGLTHHEHGVHNVLALGNVAIARGWVGAPGCGLLPLRGHSNEQGVDSVGFTPRLRRAFADKMREVYDVPEAAGSGHDTYGSMTAAAEGRIRTAVLLGGNLWGSNPDLAWAGTAMRGIGLTAYLATKLNQGHVHGRGRSMLLLPVFARDEERQATTQESMFSYVRLSDGGSEPPAGELKSEVEVINAIASRVLPPGPFPFEKMTDHRAIRDAIAAVVPGYAAIGEVDGERGEFRVAGRGFHEARFNTPSMRIRAHVPRDATFRTGEGEFRLMTVRSESQFNTVVYDEEDVYRGIRRRDVVMMNEQDARELRLGPSDPVTLVTDVGRLEVVVAFADLPQGNVAAYYPEANVLVPRRVDPESGTPAFKSVACRIEK